MGVGSRFEARGTPMATTQRHTRVILLPRRSVMSMTGALSAANNSSVLKIILISALNASDALLWLKMKPHALAWHTSCHRWATCFVGKLTSGRKIKVEWRRADVKGFSSQLPDGMPLRACFILYSIHIN